MKIEITTQRGVWVGGKRTEKGENLDVSDNVGEQLISLGFAKAAKPGKKAKSDAEN